MTAEQTTMVEQIREWERQHGRPPTVDDFYQRDLRLPAPDACTKQFSSVKAAIAVAVATADQGTSIESGGHIADALAAIPDANVAEQQRDARINTVEQAVKFMDLGHLLDNACVFLDEPTKYEIILRLRDRPDEVQIEVTAAHRQEKSSVTDGGSDTILDLRIRAMRSVFDGDSVGAVQHGPVSVPAPTLEGVGLALKALGVGA